MEPDLLARVRKEWEVRVDVMVERLFAAGKITRKHADKDFFTRLIHVHEEFPGVSILMHKGPTINDVRTEGRGRGAVPDFSLTSFTNGP